MMGEGFGYTMGYGPGWIFLLLCLVLIYWFYSVIIARNDGKEDGQSSVKRLTAKEILEQRFAEGKIDENEFNKRLAILQKNVMP